MNLVLFDAHPPVMTARPEGMADRSIDDLGRSAVGKERGPGGQQGGAKMGRDGSKGTGDQRRAWDAEYSKPDPLWKGPSQRDALCPAKGRVLELGCGNGKTAAALVRAGGEVVAVDFSRPGLMQCGRTIGSPDLALVEADVRALPFVDRSFDQVVAFHVLGHLMEGERFAAVEEIERVLRPEGGLLVRVFASEDLRCGKGEEIEPRTFLKGSGIPCHFFEQAELEGLLGGFRQLVLQKVVTRKRYGITEVVRAELVGAFRSP